MRRCFVGVAEHYRDVRHRVAQHPPGMALLGPAPEHVAAEGRELLAVARAHSIELLSCSEPAFAQSGMPSGACVDSALLNALAALGAGWESDLPAETQLYLVLILGPSAP